MRVLELFSGTHSVGKIAREKGWDVISLDLTNADINIDILEWDFKEAYPESYFDIIWASPPCRTFSTLRRSWIGRKTKYFGNEIVTKEILDKDMLECGVTILRKTEEIIDYFKPKWWYIENPATSRMKDFISVQVPSFIVDYCQYANWGYRKRTRIWYGGETRFRPKLCHKDCQNKNDNGKHKDSVSGDKKWTPLCDRYRIPPLLIEDLFNSI